MTENFTKQRATSVCDIKFFPKNLSSLKDECGNSIILYGNWKSEDSGLNETLYQENDLGYKMIKYDGFNFSEKSTEQFKIDVNLRLCFTEYSKCDVFELTSKTSKLSLYVESRGWPIFPKVGNRLLKLEYVSLSPDEECPICVTIPLKITNPINWKHCIQHISIQYDKEYLTMLVKIEDCDTGITEKTFTVGKCKISKYDVYNLKLFIDPFKELKVDTPKIPRYDGLLSFVISEKFFWEIQEKSN